MFALETWINEEEDFWIRDCNSLWEAVKKLIFSIEQNNLNTKGTGGIFPAATNDS